MKKELTRQKREPSSYPKQLRSVSNQEIAKHPRYSYVSLSFYKNNDFPQKVGLKTAELLQKGGGRSKNELVAATGHHGRG
jgi:hypothetical protein